MFILDGDWKVWIQSADDAQYCSVGMVIYGEKGKSGLILLGKAGERGLFMAGNQDQFKVCILFYFFSLCMALVKCMIFNLLALFKITVIDQI